MEKFFNNQLCEGGDFERSMTFISQKVCNSSVESIVDSLARNWIDTEDWMNDFLLKVNQQFNRFRNNLRQQDETSSQHDNHFTIIAQHYFDLAILHYEYLFQERKIDLLSVIRLLTKSLYILNEIPPSSVTDVLKDLKHNAEDRLDKLKRTCEDLSAENMNILDDLRHTSKCVIYFQNCVTLGQINGNRELIRIVDLQDNDKMALLKQQLMNIVALKVIVFLEESITPSENYNQFVISKRLLALSDAYAAVRMRPQSEQYKIDAEHLLKSTMSSEGLTSSRENVKKLIMEQLLQHKTLPEVNDYFAVLHGISLSPVDQSYIEMKYISICSNLFIQETVQLLKELSATNRRHTIMEIFSQLNTANSIKTLHGPLAELSYFNLLMKCQDIMKMNEECQILQDLKQEGFAEIIDYVHLAKKELIFLESFITFINSFKDSGPLEETLRIAQFCNNELPFVTLLQNIRNLRSNDFGKELEALKFAVGALPEEDILVYVDTLKEFMREYVKPPTIQMTHIDGRNVLEVCGKKLVTSAIMKQAGFKELMSDSSCEEIRFIGTWIIHADTNFEQSMWHGKNLVILTKTLMIHENIIWDVSGMDGENKNASNAGNAEDGSGKCGEDGSAGESGGNVLILTEYVCNSENLVIISNGGKGGTGQDGGNGQNGYDGKSISKHDFETKFPAVAKIREFFRYTDIKTTLQSIKEYSSTIKLKWYERPVTNISKYIPGATFYRNVLLSDSICTDTNIDNIITDLEISLKSENVIIRDDMKSFRGNIFIEAVTNEGNKITFSFERGGETTNCQAFLLFKGADGKPGQKGGKCGLGGDGGFNGEVEVKNPNDYTAQFGVEVLNSLGEQGKNGHDGREGSHGKTGWDIGYLDYSVSNFFTEKWPKFFGFDENSKLTLRYYSEDNHKRIWCPYRRYQKYGTGYVDIESSIIEHKKGSNYEDNATVNTSATRQIESRATRKKTISQANVLSNYSNQFTTLEKMSFHNLIGQLENANSQALLAIAEIQRTQEKQKAKTKITKCTVFYPDAKLESSNNAFQIGRINTTDGQLIINKIQESPSSVELWSRLKELPISKSQLDVIFDLFETLQYQHPKPTMTIKTIKDVLIEKYRFATLNEISCRLSEAKTPVADLDSLSAVDATKYLTIVKNCSHKILHPTLGNLNQYLYSNNELARSNLAVFYEESCKLNKKFYPILKTFILEIGRKAETVPETKIIYDKYMFYLNKNKRGFISFKESLDKLNEECSKNESVINQFLNFIQKMGSVSDCGKELLANVFNVNMRFYVKREGQTQTFILKKNLNSEANRHIYILDNDNECIPLDIDMEFLKLEQTLQCENVLFTDILNDVNHLTEKRDLENYAKGIPIPNEDRLNSLPDEISKVDENTIVRKIVEYYSTMEDKILLGTRLNTLRTDFVGESNNILDCVLRKFVNDGRHISAQEMCYLINSVIKSVAQEDICSIYRWIVMAHPQDQWLNEILLRDADMFFRKPLSQIPKWRKYLQNVQNKCVLFHLKDKIEDVENYGTINVDCFDNILYLLNKIPRCALHLQELGLSEWPYALKEKYWAFQMSHLMDWKDDESLLLCSYYALCVENIYGFLLVKRLIKMLKEKKGLTDSLVFSIFSSFYNEKWNLTNVELNTLSKCANVSEWVAKMQDVFLANTQERGIERLVNLMQTNANTSENIKTVLQCIHEKILTISKTSYTNDIFEFESHQKPITEYSECDINLWVESFKIKMPEQTKSKHDFLWAEMLAVVDRAIHLKRGFKLRDTQKLAVLILLKNGKSTLAQVSTGEGKSLIVVAVSILKALIGEKIDIITSSSVLARRDAENNKDIFNLFGINVAHNCSEDIEMRKAAYSGHQVVYGDLSDFQRDYLLHEFYGKNVLGDRKFESVIIDEVDSMLLDKGNNMLYLSHDLPGLDKLESLYLFIWQWINSPTGDREDVARCFDVQQIKEAIMFDLFGIITVDDIKALDVNLNTQQAHQIWERLLENQIIDTQAKLLLKTIDEIKIEEALAPNFLKYNDRICFLLNECLSRDKKIFVPLSLRPFIERHLELWIKSAITAFFMNPGEHYVVDIDRTGISTDRNPNITIIDKDTGTDQANTQWEEALHQFLQLKHGCKLSVLSLKAVFISNVSYFKLYEFLYGLTGTLGSQGERTLLQEVHEVEFATIPTAKPKQFKENLPTVCTSVNAWTSCIYEKVQELTSKFKRSVLVICETVNQVDILHQAFGGKNNSHVHTYTRDFEEFDVTKSTEKLGTGQVIIATNLAGRGTDIKINDELTSAGGLHVIMTYLSTNARIEQQAFGRAARCGEQGSGELIIMNPAGKGIGVAKILDLKNKRDIEELRRISEIKLHYKNQICVEEECFSQFKKHYFSLKQLIKDCTQDSSKNTTEYKLEDILLNCLIDKWAYWLDKNVQLIKDSSSTSSKGDLEISLKNFTSEINQFKNNLPNQAIEWVDKYPVQMLKLGKYYLQIKNYCAAIGLFDRIIQEEPEFSESAHYYKAYALGQIIKWESISRNDHPEVKRCITEFQLAKKLFNAHSARAVNNSNIVAKMKSKAKRSIVQIEAYEEQQKNIVHLYNLFSGSIDDILGHSVMPQNFTSYYLNECLSNTVHSRLLAKGILKHSYVTMQNISEEDITDLSLGYNVPAEALSSFLEKHQNNDITSFNAFKSSMKNIIILPSKEKFWKELIGLNVLKSEIKYVIIDDSKLAEIDPSLLESLNNESKLTSLTKQKLTDDKGQIFLNFEQLAEQKTKTHIYIKNDFISQIGRNKYLVLKKKGVFSFNRKSTLTEDVISNSAVFSPSQTISLNDFTKADINLNDAESIITNLLKVGILAGSGVSDKYIISGSNEEIEKLNLVNFESYEIIVKRLLTSKNSTKGGFYFLHHDSISEEDFTRNNVREEDAVNIIHELVKQRVLKEDECGKYRLVVAYEQIEYTHLSIPVYSNITKSLLKACFSYRIAFQKLIRQVEEEPLQIRLTTKPYLALFWDLYDMNVISPIKVCPNENYEEQLKIEFNAEYSKSQLKQLFSHEEYIPNTAIDDKLIENLLVNDWLAPSKLTQLTEEMSLIASTIIEKKFTITKPQDKRKQLEDNYKSIQSSLEKLFNNSLKISNDINIKIMTQSLERLKSTLECLEVPRFNMLPLAKACAEGDFSNVEEIYNFQLYGLNELIVLEEEKYTTKMIVNTAIVIAMGLCQIAIGAIIDMWSVGAATFVGNAFMNEGISDICFAIGALRSGYFSWKEYGKHKIESMALTALTVGVGAYFARGTKFSNIGSKLGAPSCQIGQNKVVEMAGAHALKAVNASVGKQIIKQIALKTIEGVAYGAANVLVDSTIENGLQSLSQGIAGDIQTNIDEEVEAHNISKQIDRITKCMPLSDAKTFVSDLTQQFFRKTSDAEQFCSVARKIFSGVSRGISEAASKKMQAGQNRGKLQLLMYGLDKTIVWGEKIHHLWEIRQLTSQLLDDLAKEIDEKLKDISPAENISPTETECERFKRDVIDNLKSVIRDKSGQIISQQIINPLLKAGAQKIINFMGRSIKDYYKSYKEYGYSQLFEDYKKQYMEDIDNSGDDIQLQNKITEAYNKNLMELLSHTRSPMLFAKIVRENIPMDMTCLEAVIKMLPFVLEMQGVKENVKIVVVKGEEEVEQQFANEKDPADRVIRLRLNDNHFELVNGDRHVNNPENSASINNTIIDNDCLYRALSQHIDLGMSAVEFRQSLARTIEQDQEMHHIIKQGWHEFSIKLNMYGGRSHPYEYNINISGKKEFWIMNDKTDVNLCRGEWITTEGKEVWVEQMLSLKELHEQRTAAYNTALQKINEYLADISKKPIKIQPKDFEGTMYDTVRTTVDFGDIGTSLYPVEIKVDVNVQTKSGGTVNYQIKIDIDAFNRSNQRGPHGPHIGYEIVRHGKIGPNGCTGHILINQLGNENMPHRAKEIENKPGVYYTDKTMPSDITKIPVGRLFTGPLRMGTYLERQYTSSSTRGKSFPSSGY